MKFATSNINATGCTVFNEVCGSSTTIAMKHMSKLTHYCFAIQSSQLRLPSVLVNIYALVTS